MNKEKQQKKPQFNHYTVSDKNVLENTHINDLGVGRLYEVITGFLPCEVAGTEYTRELFDFVLNHSSRFELVTHYSWNKHTSKYSVLSSVFDDDLDTNSYQVFNYFFYSSELDLVISLRLQEGRIELSLASAYIYKIEDFLKSIEKFKYTKEENKIGIINTSESGGLSVKEVRIKEIDVNVELNYGKEFLPVHNSIVNKLKENSQGLFLLHSKNPGTGKSTYIKYLSSIIKEKLFIFVSSNMIESILQPNLITSLLIYPNSVLIMEDAEQAVISREENPGNSSLISNILNIGDGIIGSLLNLNIILTFNTPPNPITLWSFLFSSW